MNRIPSTILLSICAALLSCGTDNRIVEGSGTHTGNARAKILNPDGTPAVGVKVRFFPSDADPRTHIAKSLAPHARMDSTITDQKGEFQISLDSGSYNLLAATDSLGTYSDSIKAGEQNTIVDTLKPFGSIRARVRLYGLDDPRTIFVLAVGTDAWTAPDETGGFALAKMAQGRYRIRIFTTLDNYRSLDTTISIRAATADTLSTPIVLPYIGIPVPGGLGLAYDTAGQIITLNWSKPLSGRSVAGYNIYRKRQDSGFVRIGATAAETTFTDSTLSETASYSYCLAAIDTQQNEGVKSNTISVNFRNRLRQVVAAAPFGKRREHTSVAFNGKIWLIGGTDGANLKNDIWSSPDGTSWTKVLDSAPFSPRRSHASVVFQGKMWVIGGMGAGYLNDVWSSSDGSTWVRETESAAFSARMNHACDTLNGKMWLTAGLGNSLNNDVWSSLDGQLWTRETEHAEFPARDGHALIAFDNKLWIMAGAGETAFLRDVWSSSDGVTWTQTTDIADFEGRRDHALVNYQNSLWLIGGYSAIGYLKDVWHSSNGIAWTPFRVPPTFNPVCGHSALIHDGRIWIVNQRLSATAFLDQSDVWSLK